MLDTINEKISVNKIISNKREIIIVEGDMIVPDSKPDVLDVICTSGVVCVYKKDIMNDKIRIEGNIDTYIMYLADSENDRTRGITTNLDFSETIKITGITEEMQERCKVILKSIESRVINGRKIGIKATLEVEVEIYDNEQIEIINDINQTEDVKIQMLKDNLMINSLIGVAETKIYAKETIKMSEEDNLAEILKTNINIGNEDIKISYNKVLTKAEANVKIMYLTEDGRIKDKKIQIPIVGFIDISDITEENICDVDYEIKNLIIKLNPIEEHSIYLEMEVGVKLTAYEEKEIALIQDLYSPCSNISFNKKNITTMMNKKKIKEVKNIKNDVLLDDMENKKIIDVDIVPMIENIKETRDKIICEGNLELNIILNDSNRLERRNEKIPFSYEFDYTDDTDNIKYRSNIEVLEQDFIVQENGSLKSNIEIALNMETYENSNLNVMDSVEEVGMREEEDYSVAIYIVKQGDTLWNIAKIFGTTIDNIVRVNGLEDKNKIIPGDKLFIPRYMKTGVTSG